MSDAKPNMPRWASLYLAPVLLFAALSYFTEDKALILVANIVLTSLSVVVVITFTPEQIRIARDRGPMTRGAWFAYGIWWGWGAILCRTVETLVWRYMGQPMWLVNSDVTSWNLFMGCIGAIGHIIRPGDLAERLPRREVIRIALIVGFGVFLGLAAVEWPDVRAAWAHQRASWLKLPGLETAVAGPPPMDYRSAADVPPGVARAMARPPEQPALAAKPDIVFDELFKPDPVPGLVARVQAGVSVETKARVEQYRAAHALRSQAEAVRQLLDAGLDADDRAALGAYDPAAR